ncbi:hypothetical protein FRC11_004784 [Ceratobasidium sp. 423]|nr:hypothetical protein FRC11_004784 [Ceratobasidium sp. 423]
MSTSRPSEAAPLYLFLARLQGERFKTERNPALVLRLARDVVVNLDEASALSRQPLESAMQNLRQEMLQGQLADAQDNLGRTTRAAKNDVEDLKKSNERHLERIVELERELEKRSSSVVSATVVGDSTMVDGGQQVDSKETVKAT